MTPFNVIPGRGEPASDNVRSIRRVQNFSLPDGTPAILLQGEPEPLSRKVVWALIIQGAAIFVLLLVFIWERERLRDEVRKVQEQQDIIERAYAVSLASKYPDFEKRLEALEEQP